MPLAISQAFLLEFAALQRPVRERVGNLIRKFQADPSAKGINLEKPTRTADPRSRTVRVDQQYRAVVVAPDEGNTHILIGVFNHDDAYEWCARNRVSINAAQGAVEIEDAAAVSDAISEAPAAPGGTLAGGSSFFAGRAEKDFRKLGIEERFLPLIRGVSDESGAMTLADILPSSQGAALAMLAAGYSAEDAWAELAAVAEGPSKPTDDGHVLKVADASPSWTLEDALTTPASRSMYYVVDDDDELHRLLDKPLALWRVFLHPSQQRVALPPVYNGPARVSGGAGTGKTVVLLHRARLLSEQSPHARILVTTLTKTLAADLASLLVDLAGARANENIEVVNIDAVAQRVVRESVGKGVGICFDDDERAVFEEAVTSASVSFAPEVVRQPWRQIVLAHGIREEAAYLAAPRPGRGVRLMRVERIGMWRAIDTARRLLGARRTFLQLADDAARILLASDRRRYEHVLVDEAQDLHPAQWRLIRALVPEGLNDIFIAGDTHQRIYGNRVSLASLGIDIRGRSTRLTLNYRSTPEILRWSTALLYGETFDDLDGDTASLGLYPSRLRGPRPRVHACASTTEELQQMVNTVRQWTDDGVEPAAIAVTARTRAMCRRALSVLDAAELPATDLGTDDASYHASAVAVGTMHRLKVLEFRCVAVIGCSDDELPPRGAVTPEDIDAVEHRSDLQRERSVLYVACTHARDDLVVSWSGRPSTLLPAGIGV